MSRPELDAGNRRHCVAGTVRQEHPVLACIARLRSFRRCGRPAWRTWWLCRPCNHSHCCTRLQLASAASEARGAGGAHRPPEASAEAPPPPRASARTPRPWPAASCSLPPVSASCPRCPHLGNAWSSWFPKFKLTHGREVVAVYFNGSVQKKMLGLRTDGPICGCYHLDLYLNSAPPRWAGFEHTGQRNRIEGGASIGRRYPASTVNGASVSRRQWAERKNQSNAIINIGQDFHHLSHKAFSGNCR